MAGISGFRAYASRCRRALGADRYGEAITIDDCLLNRRFLAGDRDGVVIIPRDAVAEVVAKTEEVVATES
jgi:regulator of RNase E activity RraA